MTRSWRWSLMAIAAVGLAACALPLLLYWSELPEPMAVHWSIDERPDGSLPRRFALLPPAALIVGMLLIALIGSARAYVAGRAARVALVTAISTLAATVSATIVHVNFGRSVWTEAGALTPGLRALLIALPLAVAAAACVVALRVWRDVRPSAPASAPPLPLAPGARAYWTGEASNGWLVVTGGVLLALAALQAAVLPAALPQFRALSGVVILFVIAAIVLESFSRIRVTIDHHGVRVRFGHLGLWSRRFPLTRIAAAHVVDLDPLAHRGWGYRGSLLLFGTASIVVRAGAALKLDLERGRRLFITVDDAATGARLLNALLAREPAASVAATAR